MRKSPVGGAGSAGFERRAVARSNGSSGRRSVARKHCHPSRITDRAAASHGDRARTGCRATRLRVFAAIFAVFSLRSRRSPATFENARDAHSANDSTAVRPHTTGNSAFDATASNAAGRNSRTASGIAARGWTQLLSVPQEIALGIPRNQNSRTNNFDARGAGRLFRNRLVERDLIRKTRSTGEMLFALRALFSQAHSVLGYAEISYGSLQAFVLEMIRQGPTDFIELFGRERNHGRA